VRVPLSPSFIPSNNPFHSRHVKGRLAYLAVRKQVPQNTRTTYLLFCTFIDLALSSFKGFHEVQV
jgi:hypothetical protein